MIYFIDCMYISLHYQIILSDLLLEEYLDSGKSEMLLIGL